MSKPNALIMRVSDLLGPTYVPVNLTTGLDLNGNAPMDASAAINDFLGQATAARPACLIIDIGVACYGSILIPSALNKAAYPSIITGDGAGHVTLEGSGRDTGIYMMPGSNSHAISTNSGRLGDGRYIVQDPGGTAPAQSCVNLRVSRLYVNGNRGTGVAVVTPTATVTSGSNVIAVSAATSIAIGQLVTGTGLKSPSFVSAISGTNITLVDQTGAAANATASGSGVTVSFWASNSTTGDPKGIITPSGGFNQATWFHGLDIISASNVVIEDVSTYNIPAFAYRLGNITQVKIDGIFHDGSATQLINCDGIHFDGPASEITLSNIRMIDMIDDCIAFNCPEGYGGNISDVTMSNIILWNSWFGIFGYTYNGTTRYTLTDVTVNGVIQYPVDTNVGSADHNVMFRLGFEGSPDTTADIGNWTISNCILRARPGGHTGNSFMEFRDSCGFIKVKNCMWDPAVNNDVAVMVASTGITVSDLDIDLEIGGAGLITWTGVQNTSGGAATISRLALDMQVGAGNVMPYLIDPTNLTISDLEIKRLNPTYLAALINGSTWTNLPLIRGAGLAGSTFQIPDANVANGTLYISATTFPGDLAVKIGGTAYKVAGP